MGKQKQKFDIGNVSSLDHARKAVKKYHPKDLISLNSLGELTPPQKRFLEAYYTQKKIIAQVGAAGTGKTLLALHSAMTEAFSNDTPHDHIKIIRSAAQTREIGFTPGDVDEKLAPYDGAYRSLCDELIESYKSNNFDNMIAKGILSFESTSFLRGKTFDNTIVIFDEFQSATFHEIMTVITRLGVNSKIILCGDHRQNDLVKRNDKSGYHELMDVFNRMPYGECAVIEYGVEDIVRSGIVKSFLTAVYE